MSVKSARHQGLRRSGRDRSARCRDQCRYRCDRHRSAGDAGDAARGVGGAAKNQPDGQSCLKNWPREELLASPRAREREKKRYGGLAMYAFTFHRPQTVRQAAGLLTKNPDAKLLAGGQTLLPTMKLRLAGPPQIIDMSLIEGMSGIELSGRSLTI